MASSNMKHGLRRSRAVLGLTATVSLMLLAQGTAHAADGCMAFNPNQTEGYAGEDQYWVSWNGTLRATGNGTYQDGPNSRGQAYVKKWWEGPIYICNSQVIDCSYSWGQSHSVTKGFAINFALGGNLKNKGQVQGKIQSVIGGTYGQTWSDTTTFDWSIKMKPGQHARPVQGSEMQHQEGYFRGAWVSSGERCSYSGGRGALIQGYRAHWDPSAVVTTWSAEVTVNKEVNTYDVW